VENYEWALASLVLGALLLIQYTVTVVVYRFDEPIQCISGSISIMVTISHLMLLILLLMEEIFDRSLLFSRGASAIRC